jgi:SRSO17 transposase
MPWPGRDRLQEWLVPFAKDFGRKDRVGWARLYLEGLLGAAGRKTIEGIARHAGTRRVEDVRQALQNFIHESPWDDERVLRRYRDRVRRSDFGPSWLVVEDISVVKRGTHSVGVQRQFCPERREKVNCQIIPALFLVSGGVAVPLALRLYLPRAWHDAPARLEAAGVPAAHRGPRSRIAVALGLLDRVRSEGFACRAVTAGAGYLRSAEFHERLHARGYWLTPAAAALAPLEAVHDLIRRLKDELGLDHFEGRSWRGLHHHLCLVLLANDFARCRTDGATCERLVTK